MADKPTDAAVKLAEQIKNLKEWEGEGPEINHLALLIDAHNKGLVDILCEALGAIKSLPQDALGIGGGEHKGATRWFLRDELISNIKNELSTITGGT